MSNRGEKTVLSYSTDNGSTYAAVAEVISVSGPKVSVASVDKTVLSDTAKKFRPSAQVDGGSVDFEVYFSFGSHSSLINTLSSVVKWKILYDDGVECVFDGFLTSLEISGAEMESEVKGSLSVKVNGALTWND